MAAMRGMPAKPDSLDSSPEWPYLAASAVLTTFEADKLSPVPPVSAPGGASGGSGVSDGVPSSGAASGGASIGGSTADFSQVAAMLVRHAEPIKAGPARGRWRLRDDVRRRVLKELGSRERIQSALSANASAQPDDTTQRALSELVSQTTPPALTGRSLEELLGWDRAVEWLEAARITPLPSRTEILGRIERHKLFEPMLRLVAGFEGRDDDLRALRTYVDHLPSEGIFEALGRFAGRIRDAFRGRPPLVIYGPGGAGKSTLIAKFILDHAGPEHTQPMPFVLLDFDRSTLDPVRPDALLTEVANQVRTQFPDLAAASASVTDASGASLAAEDQTDYTKTDFDAFAMARQGLIGLLNEVAARSNRNILFVIDTFEIVQRRGPTAVYTLLKFAAELLVAIRRLRVVIVGRGVLRRQDFLFAEDVPEWTPMPLAGFDPVAGRAYLRARLKRYDLPPVSDAHLDRLVQQVNGNPLGLRLAAQVFAREGLAGVEEAIGRQRLSAAVAEEYVQGLLHARIVEHLDNEDLKKLADPGLIVRRLTPDVLSEVLAGPCGITFDNTSPQLLFIALRNEVSLVEMVNDTTVRHRPDVRLIMLPSQRRRLGDLARQIDDAAVSYWEKFTGPVERAEELYHRMWRGDSVEELERRWMPDAAPQLEDALDEFQVVAPEGEARIWLSEKLDRELPDEVRHQTSQRAWERDAERRAQRLMASRQWAEAQRVIHERPQPDWTDNGPLWLIDIDLWLLKKDGAAMAGQVSRTALDRLTRTDDPDLALALLQRRVSAEERMEDWPSARRWADESLALARTLRNPVSIFACGVAVLRMARQSKRLDDPEIAHLRTELAGLSKHEAVVRALPERPSLIRESAAELGAHVPELLIIALERLGFEAASEGVPVMSLPPELLQGFARIDLASGHEARGISNSQITGLALANGIRLGQLGPESLQALSNLYALSVDRLRKQVFS